MIKKIRSFLMTSLNKRVTNIRHRTEHFDIVNKNKVLYFLKAHGGHGLAVPLSFFVFVLK